MMGHINSLFVKMVKSHHGDEGVTRLFALAGLPIQDYRAEVVYPEEDFQVLYRAAKELYERAEQQLKSADILESQGRQTKASLVEREVKLTQEQNEFDAHVAKENLSLKAAWNALKAEQESLKVRKGEMEAKLKKASEVLA